MQESKAFNSLFQQFMATRAGEWRQRTKYEYSRFFANFLQKSFGERSINAINLIDIQAALNRRPLKFSTRRTYLAMLKSFFTWCLHNGFALRNPLYGHRAPKSEPPLRIPLTEIEARRLLVAARQDKKPYGFPIVAVALYTGLRIQNIVNLTPSRHIFNGCIVIPGNETKTHVPLLIPYHPQLEPLWPHFPLDISMSSAIRLFLRLRVTAEIPRLHCHLLRHTFVSWLAPIVSWPVVAALVGHKRTDATTTSLYTHITVEQMREALLKLPALL